MTLKKAIEEVYYWQYSHKIKDPATNFTSKLIDLFRKADMENKIKLSSVYPEIYQAIQMWENSPDPDEFFRQHGFEV